MKRRGCLINALIAGFSVLLTLFLIDAGMRLVERQRIFALEHRPDVPQVYRFTPGQVRHEAVHGNLARPGDPATQSWTIDWIIDAYGYRNATIPAQIDTLVLGDSFGAPLVTQSDALASRLSSCGRSVYNLSVGGHGPWQEYATLMLEQDRLSPKPGTWLVWMLFSGNDLDDLYLPVYGEAIKTDLTRQGPGPYVQDYLIDSPLLHLTVSTLSPHDARVADPKGSPLVFYEPYLPSARRSADDIRAHPNYPLLRDTFHALADDALKHQLKPLVVVIPSKEEIYYYDKASGFGEVIGALAEDNHLDLIDLTPGFLQRAAAGEMLYFVQDTHWNAYAQNIAAGLVCDALSKNKP